MKDAIAVKAKANQIRKPDSVFQNFGKQPEPIHTDKEIAKAADVSHETIRKGEAVLRDAPEGIKAKARSGEISIHRAFGITQALKDAPALVTEAVVKHNIDDPETINIVKRLYVSNQSDSSSHTFDEILDSGYIQLIVDRVRRTTHSYCLTILIPTPFSTCVNLLFADTGSFCVRMLRNLSITKIVSSWALCPEDVTVPSTRINGIELYWELTGQAGDPLVLVHGSWGDHSGWDPVVPTLARSFRVLTYDRRGHSRSERLTTQGSVREDVSDLAALVEHLDLAPAHILGNSFGGSIVLRLAAERPDLFRSVLVHEPPLFALLKDSAAQNALHTQQERIRVVIELLERGQMESGARQFMETIAFGPGVWEQLTDELRQIPIFNALTFLDEYRDPEGLTIDLQRLADFSPSVLLTQGDQSEPFFPLVLDEIARALPRAQRRTLAGAGHVPQLSHPEEYIEAVVSFLRSTLA